MPVNFPWVSRSIILFTHPGLAHRSARMTDGISETDLMAQRHLRAASARRTPDAVPGEPVPAACSIPAHP